MEVLESPYQLGTFRKTKNNERQEVTRARQAKADYEKEIES